MFMFVVHPTYQVEIQDLATFVEVGWGWLGLLRGLSSRISACGSSGVLGHCQRWFCLKTVGWFWAIIMGLDCCNQVIILP